MDTGCLKVPETIYHSARQKWRKAISTQSSGINYKSGCQTTGLHRAVAECGAPMFFKKK